MYRRIKKNGFTIIELSLAMTAVAILMLLIAMLTIQISKQYTRGLTMKEVNQVGAEAASDIKNSVGSAYTGVVKAKSSVTINGAPASLLCVGSYTYIANTTAAVNIKYTDGTIVRLAKIRNGGVNYCATPVAPSLTNAIISSNDPKELLSQGGDRGLTAYSLQLTSTTESSLASDFNQGRALYVVELIIGTGIRNEITTNIIDEQCKPPSEADSGGEYCAINKFTIVGRVGNT